MNHIYTFPEVVHNMWPMWLIGFCILVITFLKRPELIRVDKEAVIKWVKMMGVVLVLRVIVLRLLLMAGHHFHIPLVHKQENQMHMLLGIPWQAMLFVFWEDAVHVLPLIILQQMGEKSRWIKIVYRILLPLVMLDFGLGHAYQGLAAVFIMAMYIPITMKLGKRFGVGTNMICHTIYDLSTRLAIYLALV